MLKRKFNLPNLEYCNTDPTTGHLLGPGIARKGLGIVYPLGKHNLIKFVEGTVFGILIVLYCIVLYCIVSYLYCVV